MPSLRVFGCNLLEDAGFIVNADGVSIYDYYNTELMGGVEVSLKSNVMGSKTSVNMLICFKDVARVEATGILPDDDGKLNIYKYTTQKGLKQDIQRLFVRRAGK